MDKRAQRQTRLSRKTLRESKKKLLFSLTGIILVLILLFKVGIPLLIRFSLFISGTKQSQDNVPTDNQPSYIVPPTINAPFTATNSAQIKVTGNASAKARVALYVNGQETDRTSTKDDGSFSFDSVTLSQGDNAIKAKTIVNNKESDYSDTTTITYLNKAPSLDINSPSDGQSFSKDPSLVIKGKTDPDAKVTVNDFQVVVDNSGTFSYNMQLQNGVNPLKIIATDAAGNKTEKDIKVSYSQ